MSRKSRKKAFSGIYHIILRGNDQQNLFYDNTDKEFFINRIQKYSLETKIEIYAYCLMNNHVHILIGNGNDNMALFVKKITCSYVFRFNHKYQRTGHLFQGRYKSEPVETEEYFKTVYRYILRNPEKAGLCSYKIYPWSSLLVEKQSDYINYKYLERLFQTEELKSNFLQIKNEDICMEYLSSLCTYNDDNLKSLFIESLFDIPNPLFLNKLSLDIQKDKIKVLKKCGLSSNQIARLTGINRYFINNA